MCRRGACEWATAPLYLASWKFEVYERERGPLRYKAITGLTEGQLAELTARVHEVVGDLSSGGRPDVLGLFKSVVMVVALMRRNLVQGVAGAFFGVPQPTVSRRWDLLRPVIAHVLDEFVPNPEDVIGVGSALVDGMICPTWDWSAIPDLFSGKTRYPGFNIQIAADLDGRLVAVGMEMVHGARHDAHAYAAWRTCRPSCRHQHCRRFRLRRRRRNRFRALQETPGPGTSREPDRVQHRTLSGFRAAVERAVAHLKTWRMLSEEGGRYRAPVHKFPSALKAIVALHFFAEAYE
jgi:hypothetical protein